MRLRLQKLVCETLNVRRACLNQASGTYECIKLLASTAHSYEQLRFRILDLFYCASGGHMLS